MARFRFRRARKANVSSLRAFKSMRHKRGRSSGGGSLVGAMVAAAVYGAGREYVSQKLEPITAKVAGVAGGYADEVVLGALGYALAKGKIPGLNRFPIARDIGRAALLIESARVGSGVSAGFLGSSSSTAMPTFGIYN